MKDPKPQTPKQAPMAPGISLTGSCAPINPLERDPAPYRAGSYQPLPPKPDRRWSRSLTSRSSGLDANASIPRHFLWAPGKPLCSLSRGYGSIKDLYQAILECWCSPRNFLFEPLVWALTFFKRSELRAPIFKVVYTQHPPTTR